VFEAVSQLPDDPVPTVEGDDDLHGAEMSDMYRPPAAGSH
jgi:hypothetical protein